MADKQQATTMYFIDKLALRGGNGKGEDEADTAGCSLSCELEAPNTVTYNLRILFVGGLGHRKVCY